MNISYNIAMSRESHISTIAELAQSEGGVFTAAQAARLGVPRDALSHAVRASRLERVVRGAYRLVGTAPNELDLATALWKLTAPAAFSHERAVRWDGIVVGGATAAFAPPSPIGRTARCAHPSATPPANGVSPARN